MSDLSPLDVFFQSLNGPKPIFGRGYAPGHTGDATTLRSPDPLVGWCAGHALPIPFRPSPRRLEQHLSSAPLRKILDYAYVTHSFLSLFRPVSADVGGRRAPSVLAPERHSDSTRRAGPLIKRLTCLEWRRIQMKTDRRTRVAGVLHAVQTHRI